jgi:hypothetical protein
MANRKLTPALLKQIILEEASKLDADKKKHEKELVAVAAKTKEVDADGFADTLEKEIDHAAALKLKEAVLRSKLRKVMEATKASKKRIRALRS